MKLKLGRRVTAVLLVSPLLFGAKGGCGTSGESLSMGKDRPSDCSAEDCGPAPGMPNWECPDGTIGGPSCGRGEDGSCGWQIIECSTPEPPSCDNLPQCDFLCPQGTTNPVDANGCVHTCECVPAVCAWEDCPSPAPGAPNYECPNGTMAGPACLPAADGSCGWRFIDCPTTAADEWCAGKACGDPCDAPFGSSLPTYCGPQLLCRPMSAPPVCQAPDCDEQDCGPAPGIPSEICPDGTLAGAACAANADGTCGWHVTECAADCSGIPQCGFACPQGTENPVDAAGCTHTCECVPSQ